MNESHVDCWQDRASCAGLPPRWWFPEVGESVKEALNPAHLSVGTPLENNDDKVRKGRHAVPWGTPLARSKQTHCKRGHPFDEANTYVIPGRGHRSCLTCRREAALRYYYARRVA